MGGLALSKIKATNKVIVIKTLLAQVSFFIGTSLSLDPRLSLVNLMIPLMPTVS